MLNPIRNLGKSGVRSLYSPSTDEIHPKKLGATTLAKTIIQWTHLGEKVNVTRPTHEINQTSSKPMPSKPNQTVLKGKRRQTDVKEIPVTNQRISITRRQKNLI